MQPSNEQSEIFEWFKHGKGSLLVRARAGTGKTTTIVNGVGFAPEDKILLAAFNKEISKELGAKLSKLGTHAEVKTLHALGFGHVRRKWRVQVDDSGDRARNLAAMADPDAPRNIQTLIRNLHTKARDINPFIALGDDLTELFSMAVQFECIPEPEWEVKGWDVKRVVRSAHKAMKLAMERTDKIDFADMIFLPLVHNWVLPTYQMVIVDEAQDMTIAQLALAVGSCSADGRICVVGDDRQAIYGFRGADSESLDRLKVELEAAELGLKTTYRCPRKIVELAQQIVPDFQAHESAPEGDIAYLASERMIVEAKPGDFILSRTNAPLVRACMALMKRGTRAKIRGRDIGKGIMTLIKKLGAETIEEMEMALKAWRENEVRRAYKKLPEEAAGERAAFVQDQEAILLSLSEGASTIAEVEDRCSRMFADDAEYGAVTCSSIHRAKGLEADNVYILRDTLRGGSIEEDNIRYVAITRAKKKLIWVSGIDMEA